MRLRNFSGISKDDDRRGLYGGSSLRRTLLMMAVTNITHYENTPMQYTEIFKVVKNENFQ